MFDPFLHVSVVSMCFVYKMHLSVNNIELCERELGSNKGHRVRASISTALKI